jgi:hypothetical protein
VLQKGTAGRGSKAELDREDRELLGESEPKTWTTDQMIEQLGKVGIDVKKNPKLPARSWTPDEAYEVLKKHGVTGDDFKLPGASPFPPPPMTNAERWGKALHGNT